MPRLLPSENGFSLLFLEKTVVAYFFGVHLFLPGLGQVAVTYQSLLHYGNSLKQVLKERLLFHSLVPAWFYVAESNPKGVPSRTGLPVGRFGVWDLFVVTIILKLSLCELGVVQKKHSICIPFLQ